MSRTKIFISYARRDGKTLANRLRDDLIAVGYDTWLDTSEIEGGASWSLSIEHAIDDSGVTLALLSDGSYRSEICRAEHLRSLRKGKRVIPLMVQHSAERPLYLEHLHYLDFSSDTQYRTLFDDLLKAIADDKHVPLPAAYQRTNVSNNAPPSPPHFLERREVLDRLRAVVTSDASDRRIGIMAIQGMGGIGKTVMAAALCRDEVVQDAYPDGIVWITIGQNPVSLLLRLRYLLEALGEAVSSNDDQEAMVGKLRTVLPKKAALIVLDDVWDVEAIQPFIVENAPAARLLFTTRDASLVTALGGEEFCLDVLPDDQARQLLAEWTDSQPADLPPEAGEVAHQSGNLPLALSLCGAVVRDGDTWISVLDALREADLTYVDHPYGSVMKSIKISLDALERDNPAFVRHYLELGVFPDDVTLSEDAVLTLWLHTNGLNERSARRLVTTLGRRALLRVSGEQPHRTVELHDIQHLYVRGALSNLRGAHEELLEAYRSKCRSGWASGPNDGYFFEHLTYHLREAGRHAELYDLLTASPAWMEAKFAACVGDTSYAADLDQAIADFADPLDADRALILARLHAARQVVHARASSYDNIDLRTLVWLGRKQEALSYARLRREPKEQFSGLMAIYETQKKQSHADVPLLKSLLPLVRSIQDDMYGSQAEALCVLAVALSQVDIGQATVVFREAEDTAHGIHFELSRAWALCSLAAALAQAKRFDEAGEVARAIQQDDARAAALRKLTAALTQAERLDEAGEVARTIQDAGLRSSALCDVAEAMAQAGNRQSGLIFREIGEVARTIQDVEERERTLHKLATTMAQAGDSQAAMVFGETLDVAYNIEEEQMRTAVLRSLAAALAQAKWFEEAGEVVHSIEEEQMRTVALCDLAEAMAQAGNRQAAGLIFREARGGACAIQGDDAQASALHKLTAALAQAERLDEAMEVAHSIQDAEWRSSALCDLARAMAQAGDRRAAAVFDEARKLSCNSQNEYEWAKGLMTLAVVLVWMGHRHAAVMLDEASKVARSIQDEDVRSSVLSDLAAALTQAGQFDEAEEVASDIQKERRRAEALFDLAAALTQRGQFDKAGKIARSIPEEEWKRAAALDDLAQALAQVERFDEAEEVASAIEDAGWRARALRDLAKALAQTGRFNEAREVAHAIQDAERYAESSCDLAKALAQIGRFDEAGEVAHAIQDVTWQAVALCDLLAALAREGNSQALMLLDEVREVVHSIHEEDDRAFALSALVSALAQAKWFDEAVEVAHTIEDEHRRASALCNLAVSLAQAGNKQASVVLNEAGEVARAIQEKDEQAFALGDLAEMLTQAKWFDEAVEVAHAIRDEYYQAVPLRKLAVTLAQVGRFDEAGEVTRSIPEESMRAYTVSDLAAILAQMSDRQAVVELSKAGAVARGIREDIYGRRAAALRDLAAALARLGCLVEAFATLGKREPAVFIQEVAKWNNSFDTLGPGLFLHVLQEVLRIIGWERPDWHKIHELLTTGEQGLVHDHE